MAAVRIAGTSMKYFDDRHVIRGVDIDIADGGFAVLVGPSGCGKSTLLHMIAGLEEIGDGGIEISGKVADNVDEGARRRHGVPELHALPAHEGARRLAFGAACSPSGRAPRSTRGSRRAAAILGHADLLDRCPRQAFRQSSSSTSRSSTAWCADPPGLPLRRPTPTSTPSCR